MNAGHVLPFIIHRRGDVEYLREGGMVLGPSPNATYLRGFAQLLPDDILVLYTDGITECHHHRTDEEFGVARLQRLVARHADRPAGEIVQTIFQAVSRYAATPIPEDDQTLVIVKRPSPENTPG